jgi:alkyldihydroxyacetonephosphate synthase
MIDMASLLMEANGRATVVNVEASLTEKGLTLGLDVMPAPDVTVADWLAAGAPGAPSALHDPADHLIAGLAARLGDGRRFEVRPSPRRAVGPDLVALCVACGTRFATIERAWLRAHRKDAPRPRHPLPALDLDPAVEPSEAKLLDAIADSLRTKR